MKLSVIGMLTHLFKNFQPKNENLFKALEEVRIL